VFPPSICLERPEDADPFKSASRNEFEIAKLLGDSCIACSNSESRKLHESLARDIISVNANDIFAYNCEHNIDVKRNRIENDSRKYPINYVYFKIGGTLMEIWDSRTFMRCIKANLRSV
jgi:hypothetical protein